jgi:hypothetical protein
MLAQSAFLQLTTAEAKRESDHGSWAGYCDIFRRENYEGRR